MLTLTAAPFPFGECQKGLDKNETTGHIEEVPRPSAKQKILHAALEVIHKNGFYATSVQDIANAGGAPKGSVYNHFPSKDALCAAALELYLESEAGAFALLQDASLPPKERILRHFEALSCLTCEGVERGCLVGNLAAEASVTCPQVRQRIQRHLETWSQAVTACILEEREAGASSPGVDAADLASFCVNAFQGAVLRAKADGCDQPLHQFQRVLAHILE